MSVKAMGEVRIGCSGWQYKHWRGNFYPKGLPQQKWLEYYADIFDTVEINNSFYRLPEASTFANWRNRAPETFLFAVKASRYITHMKKLKDPADPLKRLWDRTVALEAKLGPVLYQLPSRWPLNETRLQDFLQALPKGRRQTIEFRDSSWYTDKVYHALEAAEAALCLHDMPGSAPPRQVIGPFVYIRFHGADEKYQGGYPPQTLAAWAKWLAGQARSGKDIYVYFNNDVGGHAPRDALQLRHSLSSRI